ncbi:MAG: hypothetical protein M3133_09440 [Actinomycetota bacterium]|nr:hypothetical protein [Actinomycetota bacterium]
MSESPGTPSDERAPDPVRQLRELPARYRNALRTQGEQAPASEGEDLPPEAVEEAAKARDVLEGTARRVERLLEASKPLGDPAGNPPPKRGHYGLDPDVVLDVLDANAERLAQLAEAVPDETADRGPGIREGVQSITGELVNEAVTESERRLRDAERAVDDDSG